MAGWDALDQLVKFEITQRTEEGCDTSGMADKLAAIAPDDREKLMALYEELRALPIRPDFPYSEPSELEDIRAARPLGSRTLALAGEESALKDKFHGAWLGRSVGCALGKPLESKPYMAGSDGRPGWRNVQLWFEGADAWPIQGYTPEHSRAEQAYGLEVNGWCKKSTREHIRFMESDDDIRYTVLGMLMLEEKGLDWDSWDIGKMWHSRLTYAQVCTAETQAYLNFAHVTSHITGWTVGKPSDWPERRKWVREHLNPYREWIGAQIRADGFAYGAAGRPELAAELAWRDASFSHVKNGIYGEMFVAAMIAAAFAESDPLKIVRIGLGEIPANCRLASDIGRAIDIALGASTQLELVEQIWEAFKHYDPVHTNNNAALVAAALIFGQGDFERSVTTAVLGGWDTDCNGATIGSIVGAMLGARALPESWTAPLNDTLYAEVNGFHPISISECGERSYRTYLKLLEASQPAK
ncbi:ADP-ribosylglycohydrolase family protein [Cohnella sp. GCM10027633]|uniref:ADP-ribosylglycohydrolase family protein n=1 Tax=unclassified Cohnella TaxID=2636738 RepID=UPI0036450B67